MNDGRSAAPAETLAAQAAEWIVRLSDDDAEERHRAAAGFSAWKAADPDHAAAAARLETLLGSLDGMRRAGTRPPARKTLDGMRRPPRPTARHFAAALAVAAALFLPGWLAWHGTPPTHLLADLHTGRGEWTEQTLADGSRIALNGLTAVNLAFDAGQRTVELLHGDVLIDVAPDTNRPFVVETAHGRIQALGTRFLVSRTEDSTELSMIESRVEVRPADDAPAVIVSAGESLRFGPGLGGTPQAVDGETLESAWRSRQLVVRDRPLAAVLDELARHHRGQLRYDRDAIAGIRVSAVLPLADTERALQLLANNFPDLRIRTLTPYLVVVDRVIKH